MKLIFSLWGLHLLALITPGPDLILTIRKTLIFGKKSGFFGAIGFGLGIFFHSIFSILGIYLLLNHFSNFKFILSFLGASYLIWIGISGFIRTLKNFKESNLDSINNYWTESPMTSLKEALLTNLLNPKAGLFILGLFSTLSDKKIDLFTYGFIGVGFILLTIIWFSIVAFLFDQEKIRLVYFRYEKKINYFFCLTFLFFGVSLILN